MVLLPHGLQETILRGSAPEQNALTILLTNFVLQTNFPVIGHTLGLLKPRAFHVQIFMKVRSRRALVPVRLLSLLAVPHLFLPLQDKKCVLLAGPC